MKGLDIIIAGVGGQGVLLSGRVIALAALAAGYDVKQSEVHGMAQRGGSVVSHVRFGEKVFSPTITRGECGLLIGFEPVEALRNLHFLREGGSLVCNTRKISTLSVSIGAEEYPTDVQGEITSRTGPGGALLIDGTSLAVQAGDPRTLNLVLLGAALESLPFSPEQVEAAIKKTFTGKILDLNIKAFRLGRAAS
ncbi:MAG: indolepyruvate oxidoreductase subunit beta [Nitrospirota bacterium]